jgi:hypothetical protein
MVKNLIKSVAGRFGYDIRKQGQQERTPLWKVHQYLKPDGSFDYEQYRQIQTAGNKQKIEWVWAVEGNIAFLAEYIKRVAGNPKFGICHGTRRGMEQQWFRKLLGCEVIGTEISDTAHQFPHTIQWDFHETKPEWLDAVDFIYSNSFDHSYDPERCLNAWMSCVRKGGVCILEHTSDDSPTSDGPLDPFKSELIAMPYLITTWGKGRYCVRELMKAPKQNEALAGHYANENLPQIDFIVIERL